MPRIRDLIPYPSALPTGTNNAITDVSGVSVGHGTLIEGDGEWTGAGPYRTGVTVILPHEGNLYEDKVAAAVYRVNGFGKYIGTEQVRETGTIEAPIALTSTLNGPRVADAIMTVMIEQNPHIGLGFAKSGRQGYSSVNPVVGECSDAYLNDMQARAVGLDQVRSAIAAASSEQVDEGSVGGGTGMSCFGWKGGIGTASRVLPASSGGFTVGVLVQTNFGKPSELTICGVPVGQTLVPDEHVDRPEAGSIMIVLATDAPLDSRQLERLSKRASFGLARTGSHCHSGSGDFVIAFSTTYRVPDRPDAILIERPTLANEQSVISELGEALIASVEEAIYNSMLMSPTMVGRDGNVRYGLPGERVAAIVKQARGS